MTTSSQHIDGSSKLTVSRRDAAQMLGISERLLWTWTKAGHIPHLRIGTRVLYPVEQLRRWLNERTGIALDRQAINDPPT